MQENNPGACLIRPSGGCVAGKGSREFYMLFVLLEMDIKDLYEGRRNTIEVDAIKVDHMLSCSLQIRVGKGHPSRSLSRIV
jgi:hypothetical protein